MDQRAADTHRARPVDTMLADSADDAAFATTLAKGLLVLETFGTGSLVLGNMDISARTGIPRPTVARLTHTLTELGYLVFDKEKARYRVGIRALRMAHPLLADMPFRQVARPLMQEMAQAVRGTVSIGLLDGSAIVYVETARSGDVGPHVPDVGMPIKVVATAMGRAAAAIVPSAQAAAFDATLAADDGDQWSRHHQRYLTGIADVAARGFCTCLGEYMTAIHAVAVPLHYAADANRVFALNCGIPAFRLQPGQLETEIGPRLAALAASIRALVNAPEPQVTRRDVPGKDSA